MNELFLYTWNGSTHLTATDLCATRDPVITGSGSHVDAPPSLLSPIIRLTAWGVPSCGQNDIGKYM